MAPILWMAVGALFAKFLFRKLANDMSFTLVAYEKIKADKELFQYLALQYCYHRYLQGELMNDIARLKATPGLHIRQEDADKMYESFNQYHANQMLPNDQNILSLLN